MRSPNENSEWSSSDERAQSVTVLHIKGDSDSPCLNPLRVIGSPSFPIMLNHSTQTQTQVLKVHQGQTGTAATTHCQNNGIMTESS